MLVVGDRDSSLAGHLVRVNAERRRYPRRIEGRYGFRFSDEVREQNSIRRIG